MDGNFYEHIFNFACQNNASDIHLSTGMLPTLRIIGELKKIDTARVKTESLLKFLGQFLTEDQKKLMQTNEEIDLAVSLPNLCRLRVNIYQQNNGISAAFRIIPDKIRTLEELRMPDIIKELIRNHKGLILLTGPTGSGKSTTLAAMIHEINMTRRAHIITIEDPIEYLHQSKESLIHQREVGPHTNDFASALRASLREDPDVILVGEMRDLETISNALHAAETGHLVLSTLHTNSAPETVDRIINVFPSEQQHQIRTILASTIVAVISQRLVKMAMKNDRIALLEIMVGTDAVKNLIREGKTHQINSMLQTGSEFGMRTFQKSLDELRQRNLVAADMLKVDFS